MWCFGEEFACPQADEAVQSQQHRRCPFDRVIGPLALGFDAEMGADFLEGGLDLPAAHEDADDFGRVHVRVGAEEGLGVLLARRVAHQDPSDGFGRRSGTMPECCFGEDFECLVLHASAPAREGDRCPAGGGVVETCLELGPGLALLPGPPPLARSPRFGRREEAGVEPETADEGGVPRDAMGEFAGSETAVTDEDDRAVSGTGE